MSEQKPKIRVVKKEELVVPEKLIDPALRPDPDVLAQLTLTAIKFTRDGQQTGGNVAKTKLNLRRIIMSDPRIKDKYRFNIFSGMLMVGKKPIPKYGYTDLQLWISEVYGLEYGLDTIIALVDWYAEKHRSYNPIREYLEGLKWDPKKDKPKLHMLFPNYFGTKDTKLNRALGMRWILGMVARGLLPDDDTEGIKVDHIVIFCGRQNQYKGRALEALASAAFFSDSKLEIDKKDLYESIHSGIWLWEIPELHNLFSKGDNTTKAVLSSKRDRWRPPHARGGVQRVAPRRGLIVGTSNDTEILTDPTGARRYWPVTVERKCNVEGLKLDRDKLFAEAVYLLQDKNEQTWLTETEEGWLKDSQLEYTLSDSWEDGVSAALERFPNGISLGEILKGEPKNDFDSKPQWGVGLPIEKHHSGYIRRVAGICQKLGATKFRRTIHGRKVTLWKLPS